MVRWILRRAGWKASATASVDSVTASAPDWPVADRNTAPRMAMPPR